MTEDHQEQPTRKQRIQQLHENTAAKYAVFLRSETGQNARFCVLHSTLEKAVETARQHAADVAARGTLDFTYYAIEIKHRVGIEHGRLVDESM